MDTVRSFVFLLVIGNDHRSCKDVLLYFIKVRLLVFSNIRVMITVNSFATTKYWYHTSYYMVMTTDLVKTSSCIFYKSTTSCVLRST
jgi:hypothetical protein